MPDCFRLLAGSASAVHVQAVLCAGLVLWHLSFGDHVDHQGVQPQGVQWWHCTKSGHRCFVPQDPQRLLDN